MTAIERFYASTAWDSKYDLPTCPGLDNPNIYMAYADLIMCRADGSYLPYLSVGAFQEGCEMRGWRGLFTRWPDSRYVCSHDELIGICYFQYASASAVMRYLDVNNGYYRDAGNLRRFFWLIPYINACGGREPSLWGKLCWSVMAAIDAFNSDEGGHLRTWLMGSVMSRYWLCRKALEFRNRRLEAKGVTQKSCFAKEPKEFPIYAELAPEKW